MKFTLLFLLTFKRILVLTTPLWSALLGLIFVQGFIFSFVEDLAIGEALYFSLITAMTVGYGDISPHTAVGRLISVLLALTGIITTGIIVAIAIQSVKIAFDQINHDTQ